MVHTLSKSKRVELMSTNKQVVCLVIARRSANKTTGAIDLPSHARPKDVACSLVSSKKLPPDIVSVTDEVKSASSRKRGSRGM